MLREGIRQCHVWYDAFEAPDRTPDLTFSGNPPLNLSAARATGSKPDAT